jgi:hypothetical protein
MYPIWLLNRWIQKQQRSFYMSTIAVDFAGFGESEINWYIHTQFWLLLKTYMKHSHTKWADTKKHINILHNQTQKKQSAQRPKFICKPVSVGLMLDKVGLGQVSLPVLWVSTVDIIPSMLHTHLVTYHALRTILVPDSVNRSVFKCQSFSKEQTGNALLPGSGTGRITVLCSFGQSGFTFLQICV